MVSVCFWLIASLPEFLIAGGTADAFARAQLARAQCPAATDSPSTLGGFLNGVVYVLNRTVRKRRPFDIDFTCVLAAGNEELSHSMRRIKRSMSYSLLLFCTGLFGLLLYLLLWLTGDEYAQSLTLGSRSRCPWRGPCLRMVWGAGRQRPRCGVCWCASVVTLGVLSVILWQVLHGRESVFTSDGLCASGVALAADGFRALYAWLSALLFAAASVFSFQYFEGKRNVPRFAAFTLLTLSAVIGLFLSDQLLTTVMFFEVMSLASYPWIAHEETPGAMRAAQSYLWIAIIGGLCMLMGMLLLPSELLQLRYSRGLPEAAPTSGLMLPAILMLVGFGAKAGAFPAARLAAQGLPRRARARHGAAVGGAVQGGGFWHPAPVGGSSCGR